MQLKVIGSGSSGNCYLLTNGEETLVIEAGIRFLEVKKALNFNIRSIKGVIISHVHGDHAGYAAEYEAAGIPVWKPYTMENLRNEIWLGNFEIYSFGVVHDVPCCGFLIKHSEIGRMLYVTDAEYVKYTFHNLSVMLIEANYDAEIIDKSSAKFRHVVSGHLSLQTTLDCIKANRSDELNHIILCHLSEGNGDPEWFRKAVEGYAPIGCTVDVASPGLEVELGDTPF